MVDTKEKRMNKYEVTLHTFCDACVNGTTCKGTCKRMQTLEKLISKYERLSQAYDRTCYELSVINGTVTKDAVKEMFLNGH